MNVRYCKLKVRNVNFSFILIDCANTDDGHLDEDGDSCDDYESSWCGQYDDDDFQSNAMCCICGGGATDTGKKELNYT